MVQILENGFVINGKYVEVLHDVNAFKVGDIVEVIDEFDEGYRGYKFGWPNYWASQMHVGEIGKIVNISEDGCKFKNGYFYPSSVLTKLVKKDNISTIDKELIQSKLGFITINLVNIQNLVEEIQEQLDKE